MQRGGMECDNKCGCAVPCPGGTECRCTSRTAGGQREHTTCQCGEHCECAPCTCGRAMMPSGREGRRANCSCGAACGCASCASTSA